MTYRACLLAQSLRLGRFKKKKKKRNGKWNEVTEAARQYCYVLHLRTGSENMKGALTIEDFCARIKKLRISFFPPILETRRVDYSCNPPVQEAENTLLRSKSLFHYITGFTGLTYSEWPLQKRSSAQAIISDAYRQIKNHTQFILSHNNKQVRRYYIAEYLNVYF